jgi:hypothetical protein
MGSVSRLCSFCLRRALKADAKYDSQVSKKSSNLSRNNSSSAKPKSSTLESSEVETQSCSTRPHQSTPRNQDGVPAERRRALYLRLSSLSTIQSMFPSPIVHNTSHAVLTLFDTTSFHRLASYLSLSLIPVYSVYSFSFS